MKDLQVGHEDIYSLITLNNILGGSMSSRLFQEVREKRGLAYSVFSYHSAFEDTWNCNYIWWYRGKTTRCYYLKPFKKHLRP